MENKSIRSDAFYSIKGKVLRLLGATILMSLMLGVLQTIEGLIFPFTKITIPIETGLTIDEFTYSIPILSLFVTYHFSYGLLTMYLKNARGESFSIADLFNGFKRYFKVLFVNIIYILMVGIGTALLIVPGIYLAIRYSQVQYIIYDNPELSIIETFKRSAYIMDGRKMNLFLMYLFFFLISLAIVVVFGILIAILMFIPFLLLVPVIGLVVVVLYLSIYIQAFLAEFYREVSGEKYIIVEEDNDFYRGE